MHTPAILLGIGDGDAVSAILEFGGQVGNGVGLTNAAFAVHNRDNGGFLELWSEKFRHDCSLST